jgi:hypothetical protein
VRPGEYTQAAYRQAATVQRCAWPARRVWRTRHPHRLRRPCASSSISRSLRLPALFQCSVRRRTLSIRKCALRVCVYVCARTSVGAAAPASTTWCGYQLMSTTAVHPSTAVGQLVSSEAACESYCKQSTPLAAVHTCSRAFRPEHVSVVQRVVNVAVQSEHLPHDTVHIVSVLLLFVGERQWRGYERRHGIVLRVRVCARYVRSALMHID